MKSKNGDRPKYSETFSVKMLKADRERWIQYSDKLGFSGNRFFAKAISEYINMIEETPDGPIKIPFFLVYCRKVIHSGNHLLQQRLHPPLPSDLIGQEFLLKDGEKLVEIVEDTN